MCCPRALFAILTRRETKVANVKIHQSRPPRWKATDCGKALRVSCNNPSFSSGVRAPKFDRHIGLKSQGTPEIGSPPPTDAGPLRAPEGGKYPEGRKYPDANSRRTDGVCSTMNRLSVAVVPIHKSQVGELLARSSTDLTPTEVTESLRSTRG